MPAFEGFARKAGVESPYRRELLWKDLYQAAHLDVFAGLEEAIPGSTAGLPAMVRELSRVRTRAKEAAPVMRDIIAEVDPRLVALMGVPAEPSPLHVLMVGAFTTNSAVGRVGEDVAVFHCVEWFQSADGARALVAHETAHAWHRLALQRAAQVVPPDGDLAWTIFYEGLATQASRAAAAGLPEVDYFWYGHPEVEEWLPWCTEHAGELRTQLGDGLNDPKAVDTFFGAGFVAGRWRVGYYLADRLVGGLGRTLPELVALSVSDAREAVFEALATGGTRLP
jgi:hypothetical protein